MVAGRLLPFRSKYVVAASATRTAERVLSVSPEERLSRAAEIALEDPDTLLSVGSALRDSLEAAPAIVFTEADWFYRFVKDPFRPIGLFDEREYFLGEFALLAGTASRIVGRREDARRWYDRAEYNFRLTVNSVADSCRVSYQRLALTLEERHYAEVLELLPSLAECFRRLDMPQDALKCQFLEGLACRESGDGHAALKMFQEISIKCERLGNDKMRASAHVNLIQLHSEFGSADAALDLSRETLPLLQALGNRVDEAKVHWGIATLLRAKSQTSAAIKAFAECERKFSELEMFPDVAATRLVIADLLLEAGEDALALSTIVSALPVIEQYQMVPEGMAALSLLRESVRQNEVNRGALRELHGFFDEIAGR